MSRTFDMAALEWETVRPDVARGVYGKTLMDKGVKLVFTRVAAGGGFALHRDAYGHLLHFLAGSGYVDLNGERLRVYPGLVVEITAGDEHGYQNTGNEDLILISANLPASINN